MKISKKFIITSLATIMTTSLVGSIVGTFAWYQYSTRTTVSLIGITGGKAGTLEISATSANSGFQRDLISSDILAQVSADDNRTSFKINPATFTGGDMTPNGALPGPAYKNPHTSNPTVKSDGSDWATRGNYAYAWDSATAGTDYIQFDLWVKSRTIENNNNGYIQTAEDVYMTDYVLEDISGGILSEGLRVHIAVDQNGDGDYLDDGDTYYLFSNTAKDSGSSEQGHKDTVNLFGYLDLDSVDSNDSDGVADIVGGWEWASHRNDHIIYGEGNHTQKTISLESMKAYRDPNNDYAIREADSGKKLFTTPTSGATHLTITIWLEGWDMDLGHKEVDVYEYTPFATVAGVTNVTGKYYQYNFNGLGPSVINNYHPVTSAHSIYGTALEGYNYFTRTAIDPKPVVCDWSGHDTYNSQFRFGITFDVGRNAYND